MCKLHKPSIIKFTESKEYNVHPRTRLANTPDKLYTYLEDVSTSMLYNYITNLIFFCFKRLPKKTTKAGYDKNSGKIIMLRY